MPIIAKPKRIFQIAKELNISHLEIMNFMKNKGEKVSTHMTPVSPEVYDEILLEFSKDKEQSDRYRKEQARKKVVSNIRKRETEEIHDTKKITIKKIKTFIKEDDFSLSSKIKEASEKLKQEKAIEESLKSKEENIVHKEDKKDNGTVTSNLKEIPTKELDKKLPNNKLKDTPLEQDKSKLADGTILKTRTP